MTVVNLQLANQTTFNNAFLSKTDTSASNTTVGIIGLNNTSDVNSGNQIFNTQRMQNEIRDTVGIASEGDAARKDYSSNNVVANGDSHKTAIGKLDAEYDTGTGHDHDGTNSKKVSAANLNNFNNYIADWQTFTVTPGVGIDDDVSTQLSGKTPGGGTSAVGVITTAPDNQVEIRNASDGTFIEDAGGQRVYGRITESVGVWTLSYYTNEAGVETAHTLASTNIRVYFLEVFTMGTRPTIPSNGGLIGSLDLTADVIDATASQRGVVSTSAQSFGGLKTFSSGLVVNGEIDIPKTDVASGGTITALTYSPLVRLTGASTTTLQGIASGVDGKLIIIHNDSTGDLTIENESAGASASNRFTLPEATDITLLSQQSIEFFYDSSDSRWKIKSGSGNGSGSGSGGDLFKNYISNGNASSTTGWSTYSDAAGSEPVDGTGGTATGVTFAVNTTSPIDGTKDFKLSKDASNRQGKGVSYDFSTGSVFSNSRFKLSFAYDGSANFVSGANSDVRIFLYDITNSKIIRPVRKELYVGSGKYESVWDTTSSTSYRLIFHIATTNANAWDLQFKFVSTGPGKILTGPNIEDLVLDDGFTPSSAAFGTVTLKDIRRSIVGDMMHVQGYFKAGTTAANAAAIGLPSGIEIDSNKMTTATNAQKVGEFQRIRTGSGTDSYVVSAFYDGSDVNNIYFTDGTSASDQFTKRNGSDICANNDGFTFKFSVPIKNRSANTATAHSGVLRISDVLENGTRVTSEPTVIGEYRSRSKDTGTSNTFSDQAPTTSPSKADGIRLHAADYTSAQTSGLISLYDIFIGYNKSWKVVFYNTAGRVQGTQLYTDYRIISSTDAAGTLIVYDEGAGVLRINAGTNDLATNTSRYFATADNSGGISSGWFEVYVADNDYQIQLYSPRSGVTFRTATGFGSTGTNTRTFSSMIQYGVDLIGTQDATNGDYATVLTPDYYTISYTDGRGGALAEFGISKNSSSTSTSILSLAAAEIVQACESDQASTGQYVNMCVREWFDTNDIIRAQGSSALNATTHAKMIITRG